MPTLGPAVLAPQTINVPKTGVGFAEDPDFDWSDRVEMTKVRKEFDSWGDWATALAWDMVRGLSQYVDGKYSNGEGGNVYMLKNVLPSERVQNDLYQVLPTSSPFPPTVSKNGAMASTFTLVYHPTTNARFIEEVRYTVVKGASLQAQYTNDELSDLMNQYMETIENLPTGVNLLDYIGVWRPNSRSRLNASSQAELDAWQKQWEGQNNDGNDDDDDDDDPKKIPWVLLAIAAKFLLF